MSERHDVVIVGAGPAGGLLAYLLVRQGLRVLVVEKKSLPRYKPCGGGITRRALHLLPFSFHPVVEDQTYRPRIFVRGQLVFEAQLDAPAVVMVSRDRFDHFILQKAVELGADVEERCIFRNVSGANGDLIVETSRGVYKARLLAAADGVNSRATRAMHLSGPEKITFALEGEVFPNDHRAIERMHGFADFDFGMTPAGYAWIFPKYDHISAGVLTRDLSIKHLRPHYKAYLSAKGIADNTYTLRPHLIPYGRAAGSPLSNTQGLILGDAAGWTDPITGEGIFFALKAAHLAAQTIASALNGSKGLTEYDTRFHREIVTDLIYARRLAWLLFECPSLSHWILEHHGQSLGRVFIDIICGHQTYRQLYIKMLKACLNPTRLVRSLRKSN
jgi:geranylgeranyl reductase family protein